MKKIVPVIHNKIWGYEIWLVSSLKGYETKFEDNSLVKNAPLIKIIHAKEPLSVQVHPDDTLAKEIENQENGKTETWFVLDCEKNSELVLGLSDYRNEIFQQKLKENNLVDILNVVKAKKSHFYNIPAGLVHGLGTPNNANITVIEVQQPSNTTYRLYDYKRVDKNNQMREIHIDKALKCVKDLDYTAELKNHNEDIYYQNQFYKCELILNSKVAEENGWAIVYENDSYFAYEVNCGETLPNQAIFFVSWTKN
ncbi:mannose-6-phosphate isomerase [Mycoplasmopsis anatis]|uniref:class I mannose-6-phosphate isomerase n=1 Tax=Mycoplasmopsis anatis TaxID=171279 RepID=UPI001C4E247D|nr:class I mannose-6-phosphate isomerase [Mycoplasmopsis anatis]MBW0595527.1 mannose-6-phosphate isomerase [Mycoplasmopsis anatis]MBW0601915.1 mannose-6-phosphate isomerase [Mycoplasmopsis anatis]